METQREKKDNVVLIGFMGSGKSSVGIRLSYRLRRVSVRSLPGRERPTFGRRRQSC